MNVTNIYLSKHEDVKELAERIGTDIGSLEHLTTEDKKNIVAAINELKSIMLSVEGNLGDYATKQELTQAITDLINGADADSDTLKELADRIVALAQADNGLVSTLEVQEFSESQKQQARDNIGAISEADLANLQFGLTEEQVRAIIEEYHPPKVDQGLAKDYSGTGWYKATDTGVVYNKDVPEGETHTFKGDPKEYISVYTKEDARLYADRAATSNITNMSGMFTEANEFNSDISHWDTSNVTNMSGMFTEAYEFNSDISHWDTSNVTNMSGMFSSAASFNQPLNFDTSNVTDMSSMFSSVRSFDQPLNFDTSNVTDMSGMFSSAISFDQPLNFDTSNVTDMSGMFSGAISFNRPLNLDTSNVTSMRYMFTRADSFNQNMFTWDTSNVTTMEEMFSGATSFNGDISTWNTSNVTTMNSMFDGAKAFNQDLSNWCVSKIENVPYRFNNNATIWTLPRPVWGTCPRGEDGSVPVADATNQGLAKDYSGTGWYKATDTGIVYNKDVPEGETHIFEGDPKEYLSVYTKEDARLYAGRAATSNMTVIDNLFNLDKKFNVDISHWDTSGVTSMIGLFYGASAFNQDISGWDVSNVTEMRDMFSGASAFNQDLSSWCVSKITKRPYDFDYATTSWTLPKPVWGTCPRGGDGSQLAK